MSTAKIRAHLPTLPAPDYFSKPGHTIMSDDGSALLTYDATTRSGFVYHLATKSWSITAPVDFAVWATLVRQAGYKISESEDARCWLRACSPNPAGGNVVDLLPGGTRH